MMEDIMDKYVYLFYTKSRCTYCIHLHLNWKAIYLCAWDWLARMKTIDLKFWKSKRAEVWGGGGVDGDCDG